MVQQWKRQHEDASNKAVNQQHQAFAQQWHEMSEGQKAAALAAAGLGMRMVRLAFQIQLLRSRRLLNGNVALAIGQWIPSRSRTSLGASMVAYAATLDRLDGLPVHS